MKILITGIAGTGKSTIVKALNEKGIVSLDLHDVPVIKIFKVLIVSEKTSCNDLELALSCGG
jgi:broad-specificity NMP kinase